MCGSLSVSLTASMCDSLCRLLFGGYAGLGVQEVVCWCVGVLLLGCVVAWVQEV